MTETTRPPVAKITMTLDTTIIATFEELLPPLSPLESLGLEEVEELEDVEELGRDEEELGSQVDGMLGSSLDSPGI